MSAMPTLPYSGPFTRADLEAMPDDGHRYEIIDGTLIVSASPGWMHQRAVGELYSILRAARPTHEFELLVGPFDVVLADDTVLVPDLIVARRGDMTERDLPRAPLLAVEVLSPSTRRIDLFVKRPRLEAAGCPSYWVVDVDVPSATAWELCCGSYVEAGHAEGADVFRAEIPFPVEFTPRALIEPTGA